MVLLIVLLTLYAIIVYIHPWIDFYEDYRGEKHVVLWYSNYKGERVFVNLKGSQE